MFFNVESDNGSEIRGYLVPDGFSAEPEILVKVNGVFAAKLKCDQFHESVFSQRLHATSVVGFFLHCGNIPGLSETADIEITDANTGITIYRRFDPTRHIPKKVFRLETHFAPHHELDKSLSSHFQFHVGAVERYGSGTVRQALEIAKQPSTYVSGRILVRRYEVYIPEDAVTIVSLEDPFLELAARLSIISKLHQPQFTGLSERDAIMFRPAAEHFANLDLTNDRAVRARLRSASKDVLALFHSPFTQQLTATTPTDIVKRDSLPSALDRLSQFTLFNGGGDATGFAQDVAELLTLEKDALNIRNIAKIYGEAAETLRAIPMVEHLLESDLILYHFVKQAEKRAKRMVIEAPSA